MRGPRRQTDRRYPARRQISWTLGRRPRPGGHQCRPQRRPGTRVVRLRLLLRRVSWRLVRRLGASHRAPRSRRGWRSWAGPTSRYAAPPHPQQHTLHKTRMAQLKLTAPCFPAELAGVIAPQGGAAAPEHHGGAAPDRQAEAGLAPDRSQPTRAVRTPNAAFVSKLLPTHFALRRFWENCLT